MAPKYSSYRGFTITEEFDRPGGRLLRVFVAGDIRSFPSLEAAHKAVDTMLDQAVEMPPLFAPDQSQAKQVPVQLPDPDTRPERKVGRRR